MMLKTHLAVSLLFILVLINSVEHKIWFVVLVFVATMIPDADCAYSTLGKNKFNRFLQFFVKHRGFLHTFTFLFLVTLFFVMFFPVGALGFFIGYSTHLFADSFTRDGIKPFWPFSKETVKGRFKTGGLFETGLLVGFLIADGFLLIALVV